jgi:oxalate decarboxylase/phosphoglucose isomerase-like protein (cupin superfamily)
MSTDPYLITLKKNSTKEGHLSFIEESKSFPIEIKRVYWIYDVSNGAERGDHAHLNSDRIMVCLHGSVKVSMENVQGNIFAFQLKDPGHALFFPRNHWIKLTLDPGAILVVMASCLYENEQVENDFEKFKQLVSL